MSERLSIAEFFLLSLVIVYLMLCADFGSERVLAQPVDDSDASAQVASTRDRTGLPGSTQGVAQDHNSMQSMPRAGERFPGQFQETGRSSGPQEYETESRRENGLVP